MSQAVTLQIRNTQSRATSGKTIHNAAPKSYRAKFIEPGIVSYNDSGDGVVFVSKEALDRMAPTFKGCPVIFVPEHHNDAEPDTAFNFENDADPPAGIVASEPEWGDDGWQHVNLLVWDPEAQKAIANGYSVSCAYWMDDAGPGGDWHNIKYDEEMRNGHYLHMAIVPNPRYEGSLIKANAKGGHKLAIKLFHGKKKKNADDPDKMVQIEGDAGHDDDDHAGMEAINADSDSVVQLPGGGEATLGDLIAAYKAKKGGEGDDEDELSPDDEVEVDGERVKLSDLIAAYQDGAERENAEDPTDTPAEDPVDTEAQGDGVRSNSKRRRVNGALKNAAARGAGDGLGIDKPETRKDRLERGKARYSRTVENGGAK